MSKKRDRTRQGQEEIGPTEAEAMLFRLAHKVDKLKDEPWSPSKKRSKLTHLTSEGDERDGASTEEYRGVTDGSKTVEIDGSKIVEIDGSIDNKEGPSPDADSGLDLAMAPTSALRSCDGFDIVRKGGRGRGRQLMVLPGMLGLGAAGGRIGTLKDVTSASPTLYVEFPEVCSAHFACPDAFHTKVGGSTKFQFTMPYTAGQQSPVLSVIDPTVH